MDDRLSHLREGVRRRSSEISPRVTRLVGRQYVLLAFLVGLLFLLGPSLRLRLHPFFAGLIVLYLAGGLLLLRSGRPRPPRT
jgi:hypothetical protein